MTASAPPPDGDELVGVEVFEVLDADAPDAARRAGDLLPVPTAADRRLESARPAAAAVALAQTAAVAATGFVAGVATAAVLGRRRQRRLARPAAPPPGGSLQVVSSRSYLVDVHVLERRG